MDLNTSLTKSIGNESNDGKKASKKAKSSTTSSSSASGSNKIINQLMNAAAKTVWTLYFCNITVRVKMLKFYQIS